MIRVTVSVVVALLLAASPSVYAQPSPGTPSPGSPPSAEMRRGQMLYANGSYHAASIELHKVITKMTADSVANRQRAEFFMAKAMFKLKLYAASLAYFDRVVTLGVNHRFHGATLKWLGALAGVLPEASGILDKIAKYDVKQVDEPGNALVRDELVFAMARQLYRTNKFKEAVVMFGRVKRTSPLFLRAKFFTGIIGVRRYQARPALVAFKELLAIARKPVVRYPKGDLKRFENLALLQIARLFYSTQQFDLALKYYGLVPKSAPGWAASRREVAWAYSMKNEQSKALAAAHLATAPFLGRDLDPEARVLAAVIYYRKCLFGRALRAVDRFHAKYRPLRNQLKQLIRKITDNSDFYAYAAKLVANKGRVVTDLQRLTNEAFAYPFVARAVRWLDELDKELRAFGNTDKAWQNSAVGSSVLQELTLHQSLAKNDAGKLLRDRLRRTYAEFREYVRDGIKVKYEAHEAKTKPERAAFVGKRHARREGSDAPSVIPGDHPMWKVAGGFGKGASGDFRFVVRSACRVKGARTKTAGTSTAVTKPAPKKPKVKSYDEWANDEIDGDLVNPDGVTTDFRRSIAYQTRLIRLRRHFIVEMLMAAERLN